MEILKRFLTMIKSQINHIIGLAEDPEKMLNQTLINMQEQLMTAKRQVAIAIADEKRLIQEYEKERQSAIEWEQRAILAVQQGNDTLASQALQRQTEHIRLAASFEENWRAQKRSVDQLKDGLSKLSIKLSDVKRQKDLLIARVRRAQAQKNITETMSTLYPNSAMDTMERMEKKILQIEAEADATAELAEEIHSDHLLAEFKKLEQPAIENQALIELKRKISAFPITSKNKQLKE